MSDSLPILSPRFLRANALDPHDEGSGRYTISELAREFDITTRTIRFYEIEGLLNPSREGRNRLYNQRDYTRLKLILRGKRLGFSLRDIAEYLSLYDARSQTAQVGLLVEMVDRRLALLERQLSDLQTTITELREIRKLAAERLAQGR